MHFLQICRRSGEHGKDCNSEPDSRALIKASELYSVVAFIVIKGRLWRPFLCPLFLSSNLKPQTSNLKPQTSNLKPQTSNLKPQTSNLKPQTLPARAGWRQLSLSRNSVNSLKSIRSPSSCKKKTRRGGPLRRINAVRVAEKACRY